MKSLTKSPDSLALTQEKRELIKKTVARGLNDLQFEFLMNVAQARGLDPMLNQIHGIIRGGTLTIQVAIDGLRLIAERTGLYAGQDEPLFEWNDDSKYPTLCKVTVHKIVAGQRVPFVGVARWEEFFPGEKMGHMWKKMPTIMLAKTAEAQALRKAFPSDMSGLYVKEEMALEREAKEPSRKAQELTERFSSEEPKETPEYIDLEMESDDAT